MFAKIRWVCKVQSLGKHKNGWVKKKYSLGSGETKFPLGRGKKSTGSGSTGSVTEGCKTGIVASNGKKIELSNWTFYWELYIRLDPAWS